MTAFWHWLTSDLVAVFTCVLAISTIGLWFATARGIRNQANDTRIIQRAYLSVEPLGIVLNPPKDRVLGLVGIRNAGNLPARKVSWFFDMKWSSSGEEAKFPIGESRGNIVIAPGTSAPRGTPTSLLLQDLIAASGQASLDRQNEKSVFLYVWESFDTTMDFSRVGSLSSATDITGSSATATS